MLSDRIKTLPQYLLPKKVLSQLAGGFANSQTPWLKNLLIRGFAAKFPINMQEALEPNLANYACFNDFFTRHLKPDCRPIADAQIVSPVDGNISEFGQIEQGQMLQAKGRYYTSQGLLASSQEMTMPFQQGQFMTLYLAPQDYHRIHMPIDAELTSMVYVPGQLFSVQPSTVRVIPHLFARNERLVVFFNTPIGKMAMVLVGAVIVGAIGTVWHGDIQRGSQQMRIDYTDKGITLLKGEEMGYFKLGSTVILLFEESAPVNWLEQLKSACDVRFGEALTK